MMKKFFLFALALTIFAACNDDNDNGPDFETVNDEIVNGQIVDDDEMLFLGTSIVTNPDGTTFTDEYARISIFGDNRPTLITPATTLTLRMHGARFAANMPALEMQLPNLGYTPGVGPRLTFTAAGPLTPQAYINGTGWTPQAKYPITDLNGSIDNVFCTLTCTCMGSFRVQFTGRMLDD